MQGQDNRMPRFALNNMCCKMLFLLILPLERFCVNVPEAGVTLKDQKVDSAMFAK